MRKVVIGLCEPFNRRICCLYVLKVNRILNSHGYVIEHIPNEICDFYSIYSTFDDRSFLATPADLEKFVEHLNKY